MVTRRSNGELLARLAAEQAAKERKQNEKSGMMSTCSVELDPGATCSAGNACCKNPAWAASRRADTIAPPTRRRSIKKGCGQYAAAFFHRRAGRHA